LGVSAGASRGQIDQQLSYAMKRKNVIEFLFAMFLVCAYVIAYAATYANRKPAANLAYWAYTEDTPEWVEDCLYYGFYPVYFIHQRLFQVGRHTWDREPVEIPADFKG
jgi:hypothetical protein